MDYVESVLELGAIQLLREEVSLLVGRGCLVDSHIAVVVRLLASDLVQQADGDAVDTRQVPHGGRVPCVAVWRAPLL